MAKLSTKDVLKVADLIKLKLKPEEIERYQTQLNTVIPSVDVLQELNTDYVPQTNQTHGLKNIVREDEAEYGLDINKYPNIKP
jgi:aspartyl-tRNA(Asn)/glutamyl-tRNA(Gln) amidotransferase subunit C